MMYLLLTFALVLIWLIESPGSLLYPRLTSVLWKTSPKYDIDDILVSKMTIEDLGKSSTHIAKEVTDLFQYFNFISCSQATSSAWSLAMNYTVGLPLSPCECSNVKLICPDETLHLSPTSPIGIIHDWYGCYPRTHLSRTLIANAGIR